MTKWTDEILKREIDLQGIAIADHFIVADAMVCFMCNGVAYVSMDDDEAHIAALIAYLKRHGVPEYKEMPPQPPLDPAKISPG